MLIYMGHDSANAAPSVKGLAFLSVMRSLGKLQGTEGVESALSCISPELRDAFRYGTIVATGWYPVAWYRDMWKGIRAGTGQGIEIARALGRESFQSDLSLVHRVAMSLLSPGTVVSIGGRLTANYYRPTRAVFDVRRGSASAHYTGCLGWDENMWAEIAAGLELMLELSGAKHVRVRLVEGGREMDDFAKFEGYWA